MNTFELTQLHIDMLRAMNVQWQDCEYGAPEIDPKRPFGNSYVDGDLLELFPGCDIEHLRQVYKQTHIALQIVLSTLSFELGTYTCGKYDTDWKKVQ